MKIITSPQIVPEITKQLQETYMRTQEQLERDPSKATPVWEEAVSRVREIDFNNLTPEEFVKAHSYVATLTQCLVAAASRASNFNS